MVSDLSPLTGLPVGILYLYTNLVSDLTPLLSMESLFALDIRENPLDENSLEIVLPRLLYNGVEMSIREEDEE
jgi:hypothetical protein